MTADAAPTIRPLTAADAQAYRTLRLAALAEAPQAFGASYEDEAARSLDMIARRLDSGPTNCVFGAFAGADLVGTAGFIIPSNAAKSRHKGLLVGVHVAPGHRGRAIGRALVTAVIDHARHHVVLLQAAVGIANAPALSLYERLGFRQYGLEKKALLVDGAYIDEALIVLDLSADA
ncbi:MAG: GNAT family N-acetyltransferase [Hyphomicrobiales bacterium]|nr:MAG: GNAT family N-acetyltransferase [Hyphomicrobiales bacterium]